MRMKTSGEEGREGRTEAGRRMGFWRDEKEGSFRELNLDNLSRGGDLVNSDNLQLHVGLHSL